MIYYANQVPAPVHTGSNFSASGACVQSCKHRVWAFGSSSDDAVSICKINPAPAAAFFHKTPLRPIDLHARRLVSSCPRSFQPPPPCLAAIPPRSIGSFVCSCGVLVPCRTPARPHAMRSCPTPSKCRSLPTSSKCPTWRSQRCPGAGLR